MDMIRVPKDHTLKKEFTRRLRDALFVPDKDDMARIERYLRSQGKTWEGKLDEDADWILRRTKRVVPKESVLLPVVERLFEEYAPLRCASTDRPLFDEENWRQVEQVKKAIRSGKSLILQECLFTSYWDMMAMDFPCTDVVGEPIPSKGVFIRTLSESLVPSMPALSLQIVHWPITDFIIIST